MSIESFDLDRAMLRVWRFLWILSAAGTVAFAAFRGLSAGSSFLIGSILSALSLQVTYKVVASLGRPAEPRPAFWKSALLGARWLIMAAIFYVMMKILGLNIAAALCGMLVAAGAAILEILYELIHGT